MIAAALALALAAPPAFDVEQGVPADAERTTAEAWRRVEQLLRREGARSVAAPRPVRIGAAVGVPAGAAAASRPGAIVLRRGVPLDARGAAALAHEVAHQVLFEACPSASGDRLFHEAFAIAASGELAGWIAAEDGSYLPLAKALQTLGRAPGLDTSSSRRALARLIADAPAPAGRLPAAIARRLSSCEAGATWRPMRPEDLANGDALAADALVVLSRHSGEILRMEGAASLPLPFGSTLKPFLIAGAARPPPPLAPDRARPGWRCGDEVPERMDAATALLRSCNGWFLEWAARDPEIVRFGSWGAALTALGLSALPADPSEAIGIRPSLRISALGLAHAYRLLAEARPDLVDVLSRSAREGTLAHLAASPALAGVAAKTGTVLDAEADPRLGWIAAIDRDVVVVVARAGRAPRAFAGELATLLSRMRQAALGAARVQVLGLVDGAVPRRGPSPLSPGTPPVSLSPGTGTPPVSLSPGTAGGEGRGEGAGTRRRDEGKTVARCSGHAFVVARGGARVVVPGGDRPLRDLARGGAAICAGGPWMVRLPGRPERAYEGIFALDPPPPLPPSQGPPPSARQARARRGSDLVFRTTRLLYVAGVIASEDAAARGEARIALARVADANGAHSRHPARPVCDTTHCQAFLGTARPSPEDGAALSSPLRAGAWLPFSRGGAEPWREERPASDVERALGPEPRALAFRSGRVFFAATASDGVDRWEERRERPCEVLRGALGLPSCPLRARRDGRRWVFEGRGEGHGEGLDVEWAKRSGLRADEILARAYGPTAR